MSDRLLAIRSLVKWATAFTLVVNAAAMLSPVFNGGDSITYAALAQHIARYDDWVNLVLNDTDWLDKPHLPFWITALFFKLGGIHTYTYILPGFLFHLIGGYYTYRLARLWYSRDTAWLSVLLYVSIYNLMDASVEVKAETYLTGEIMAACYYWLRYDEQSRLKHLLLGALFTALALMTKGMFTLITISSGLVCLWLYRRQWARLLSGKLLAALGLSLLFAAPEIVALYLQFDLHPEKVLFGQNHVSGIKFFLWDSQFGRFFNTGPIQNRDGHPWFFLPVFLWAFLPWTFVFLAAVYSKARSFGSSSEIDRASFAYLLGAFSITFLMFSATRFQLDYYIDIIFPFAAIFCAKYLADLIEHNTGSRLLYVGQWSLTLILVGLVVVLSLYVFNLTLLSVTIGLSCALLLYVYATRKQNQILSLIIYPVVAINIVFVFLALMTALTFTSQGVSYNVAKVIREQPRLPTYLHQMSIETTELGLYVPGPCHPIDDLDKLTEVNGNFYLVVNDVQLPQLKSKFPNLKLLASMQLAVHKTGSFVKLLAMAKGVWPLETIDVLEIGPAP